MDNQIELGLHNAVALEDLSPNLRHLLRSDQGLVRGVSLKIGTVVLEFEPWIFNPEYLVITRSESEEKDDAVSEGREATVQEGESVGEGERGPEGEGPSSAEQGST